MAWKSPTNASGSSWVNLSNLYDEDTETYTEIADQTGWSHYPLIPYYSGGLWCSKVRIYLPSQSATQLDVKAYYDDAWRDVYQGSIAEWGWVTYWLPKIAFVTYIRLALYSVGESDHRVAEVDFWEIEEESPSDSNLVALCHHGQVVNDENNYSSEQHTDGKINGAFAFDGTNDYVTVEDSADDNLSFESGTQDFSVSILVKTLRGGNQTIIDKRDGNDDGWRLVLTNAYPWLQIDGRDVKSNQYDLISDGLWHHIVVSIDRSGNGTIYIDGVVSKGTASAVNGEAMDIASDLYIGRDSYQSSGYFTGDLDAVMIFNKKLTENEVAWLYNKGVGRESEWWDYILQCQISAAPKITCKIAGEPAITTKISAAPKITTKIAASPKITCEITGVV